MQRSNLFNQTDLVFAARTGRVAHTLLAGVELGRQETDNLRLTGFFTSLGPAVTTVEAPLSDPHDLAAPRVPAERDRRGQPRCRQRRGLLRAGPVGASASGCRRSSGCATTASRSTSRTTARRPTSRATTATSRRGSPSCYKPMEPVSLYASYSVSFLPRAGEQLSSLSLDEPGARSRGVQELRGRREVGRGARACR